MSVFIGKVNETLWSLKSMKFVHYLSVLGSATYFQNYTVLPKITLKKTVFFILPYNSGILIHIIYF